MSTQQKIFFYLGLILTILPGITLTIANLVTNIQGPSPFGIIGLITITGTGIVFVGLAMSVIAAVKFPKKLLLTTIFFIAHFGFSPLNNVLNDNKIDAFFEENKTTLESISKELIQNTWSVAEANEYANYTNLPFKEISIDENQHIVFFLIDGILDNCYGFAFKTQEFLPVANPCSGTIDTWEKVDANWYLWGTI